MSDIRQETRDLAVRLKSAISIDPKTGLATIKDGTYQEHLPEGLTVEHVKALQLHNSNVAAAATLALGEEAIPLMKKHKDLERVSLEIPAVGKDKFEVVIDRHQVGRNPADGKEIDTYGATRVKYVTYGVKPRGEMGKVRAQLAALAMDALGGK